MVPEYQGKEETMDNSTKFVKTKKRLMEIFRPTASPLPDTPARTTPDEIQGDEDPKRYGVRGSDGA